MYKIMIFCFGFLMLFNRVEAQGCGCCPWERYYDYTYDDCLYYGYEDIYTPPYGYALPLNPYFNYCPCRCRNNKIRIHYYQNNGYQQRSVDMPQGSYCEACGQYH